jgi:hypothetical protein
VRSCIGLGHHPELWKTAKGVVIPKPGKPDYSKFRAYWVISLLDVISKLVERTAAHLIAEHLAKKREGLARRAVLLSEAEVLHRRRGRPHEPHPTGVGRKEDSGSTVYARQVGIQQCQQGTPALP